MIILLCNRRENRALQQHLLLSSGRPGSDLYIIQRMCGDHVQQVHHCKQWFCVPRAAAAAAMVMTIIHLMKHAVN